MNTTTRLAKGSLFRSCVLCLLVLSIGAVSAASAQQKSLSAEKRAQIEKAVSSFMSASSVPGIGVAVVLEGELAWSAGFGMADLENPAPVTSSTLFRLGSISKRITATAILQLWDHGKLDLDAPVQGKATKYGLGWDVLNRFGLEEFGHDGGQQGTSAPFVVVPGRRAGVVVLANMDNLSSNLLADQILKIVLDLKNETPRQKPPAPRVNELKRPETRSSIAPADYRLSPKA